MIEPEIDDVAFELAAAAEALMEAAATVLSPEQMATMFPEGIDLEVGPLEEEPWAGALQPEERDALLEVIEMTLNELPFAEDPYALEGLFVVLDEALNDYLDGEDYVAAYESIARIILNDPSLLPMMALFPEVEESEAGEPFDSILSTSLMVAEPLPIFGFEEWEKNRLTWCKTNSTDDMSEQAQMVSFIESAARWSAPSNLEIHLDCSEGHDISISFEVGDHGDFPPFRGKAVAHAAAPSAGGEQHYDDQWLWTHNWHSYQWQNEPDLPLDLKSVSIHEMGHSLGLRHSNVNSSVMFQGTLTSQRILHWTDVMDIQTRHGSLAYPFGHSFRGIHASMLETWSAYDKARYHYWQVEQNTDTARVMALSKTALMFAQMAGHNIAANLPTPSIQETQYAEAHAAFAATWIEWAVLGTVAYNSQADVPAVMTPGLQAKYHLIVGADTAKAFEKQLNP